MTQDTNTPAIEIEIDNFVSPNAANDVPADDFIGLDMDLPVAQVADSPDDDNDRARYAHDDNSETDDELDRHARERNRLFNDARPEDLERYMARNPRPCDDCLPGRPCFRMDPAWSIEHVDASNANAWTAPIVPATWMPGDAIPTVETVETADTGTLVDALTAIATQGANNAAGQVSGSLAQGTMLGVGFNSAAGYVTALQNGVKQATADSYVQTLRQTYGYTNDQIAALTISIIEQNDLPVGPGIVVDSSGGLTPRQAMELLRTQRAQANAAARARNAAETAPTAPTIQAAITPGTLIANLLQNKNGKIFLIGRSDRRATHRKRSELVAALGLCGREDLAPKLKTNKAQFGEVMRSLNAPGLRMRAWNVTRRDVQRQAQQWPADLASRWCVGVLDGSDALGSLGEKVLIADLKVNNEITFTGGSDTMRQKVNEAFTARMGDESYNATDLLNWFRRMMQEQFHVVSLASDMFLPGDADATAPVCDMIAVLRPVLSRSIVEIDAVTGDGLLDGLMEGLFEEIEEIQEDFRVAQVKASERDVAKLLKATPNASTEEQELHARRAKVLPEAAGTFVRRLNEKTDRVTGYETLLGTERVKPVRDLIASLRATIAPLCDDTSMMAANIELD